MDTEFHIILLVHFGTMIDSIDGINQFQRPKVRSMIHLPFLRAASQGFYAE